MTLSVVKRQFNAGEISPKVYARLDLEKWQAGCRTLLNFVPLPHGGVTRRPGWEYITGAKVNNAAVRLVGFTFSNTQAYILEFTDQKMRVFLNGGLALVTLAGAPAWVTGTAYVVGQLTASGAVVYVCTSAHTSGALTEPGVGANWATVWAVQAVGGAYEITTPFVAADLPSLQFCQSYDTLIITHPSYAPYKLTRTAHISWALSTITFTAAPADWKTSDYPRTACFYQDRLVFASNPSFPSRIWASKTADYFNMTTGTNDADGLSLNLLSGQSDTIYWLASMKALLAGLDTGIMMITASGGSDSALTPTSKKASKAQQYGAANVPPVGAGNNLIHAAYPATKIREIVFSWENDGFLSNEVSILSDHILKNKTSAQLAYQANPFEIIWIRLSDGTLGALTYLVEHKVVGWSRHTSPATGSVRSIATIPGTYETELWAAIDRTINGAVVTYIERLRTFAFTELDDAFFVDSGLAYDGVAIDTVTGLSHLEACQVSYLADGRTGTATVAAGQITIDAPSSKIVVGLAYNSDLEPLTPEPDLQSGSSTFKVKRITDVQFLVRESAGGRFGPDSTYLATLLPVASPYTLVSGKICNLSLLGGWDESRQVFVRQSDPLPMSIDAIGFDLEVE